MQVRATALLASLCLLPACGQDPPTAAFPAGPPLAIDVAALTLDGVADAVYRLTVVNGDGVQVWSRDVAASDYGDGRSLSYVGTCDAQRPANTVELTILSLLDAGGAPITGWSNPTAAAPLVQSVTCLANTDARVTFDVTIARAAQQGFFDVAVSFEDVFCSAKIDCKDQLLSMPGGGRGPTAIFALACTGDPDGDPATTLYLDPVTVTCSGAGYGASVDPTGGPGNVTPATNEGPLLFGAAIYRGDEAVAGKAYWNVALGLSPAALGPAGTCTLTTNAAASAGPLAGNAIPGDRVYPYIRVSAEIVSAGGAICGNSGLDDGTSVTTVYTTLGENRSFAGAYEHGHGGAIDGGGGGGEANLPTDATLTADGPLARAHLLAGPGATPTETAQPYGDPQAITLLTGTPITVLPASGIATTERDEEVVSDPPPAYDATAAFVTPLNVTATFDGGTPACAFLPPYDDVACALDGDGTGGGALPSAALVDDDVVAEVFTAEAPADRVVTAPLQTHRFGWRRASNTNTYPNDNAYQVTHAADGRVYFMGRASATEYSELYVWDPSDDSLAQLVDVSPNGPDDARVLAATPTWLYFLAGGLLHTRHMTTGAVQALASPSGLGNFGTRFIAGEDQMFFMASSSGPIWRYVPATHTATNLTPGLNISGSENDGGTVAVAHGVVYFRATWPDDGTSYLWSYDLATDTLTRKADAKLPGALVARGSRVYASFSATGTYADRFLYVNDGSGWTTLTTAYVANCRNTGYLEVGGDLFVMVQDAGATTSCSASFMRRLTSGGGAVAVTGTVGVPPIDRPYVVHGGWLYYLENSASAWPFAINLTTNASARNTTQMNGGPHLRDGVVYGLRRSGASGSDLAVISGSGTSVSVTTVATAVAGFPTFGDVAFYAYFQNVYGYDFAAMPASGSLVTQIGETGSDAPSFMQVFGDELYFRARYDNDSGHQRSYSTEGSTGAIHTFAGTWLAGRGALGVYGQTPGGFARWDGAALTVLDIGAGDTSLSDVFDDGTVTYAIGTVSAGGFGDSVATLWRFDEGAGTLAPLVELSGSGDPLSMQMLAATPGRIWLNISVGFGGSSHLYLYEAGEPGTLRQISDTSGGSGFDGDGVSYAYAHTDGWLYFTASDPDSARWIYRSDGVSVERLFYDLDLVSPYGEILAWDYADFGGLLYIGTNHGVFSWDGDTLTEVAPGSDASALAVYGGALYVLVGANGMPNGSGGNVGNGLYRLGEGGWERLAAPGNVTGSAYMEAVGDLLYFTHVDEIAHVKLYAFCDGATGCDPTTVLSAP